MAQVQITEKYRVKDSEGVFSEDIYFGTQGRFITVRRPDSSNYEDLQTCLENMNTRIKNSVLWERF